MVRADTYPSGHPPTPRPQPRKATQNLVLQLLSLCSICGYALLGLFTAIFLPRSSVDVHWAFRLGATVSSYMP